MKKVILHSSLHVNSTVSVTVSYTFSTCPAHPSTSLSPRQCTFLTDTCGNGKWKRKRKVRSWLISYFFLFSAFIFFLLCIQLQPTFSPTYQQQRNKQITGAGQKNKKKQRLALTFLSDDQHSHHPHPRQQDRYCRHP